MKKILIMFMVFFTGLSFSYAQEAAAETKEDAATAAENSQEQESSESGVTFFAEAENVFEAGAGEVAGEGIQYSGFENEVEAVAGLTYAISDKFYIGGFLENYSDILNDGEGKSTLAEQENALGFTMGTDFVEAAAFETSLNLVVNIRPEDLLRVGGGLAVALSGTVEEAFFEYSLENSVNFLGGMPESGSNLMIADTFTYGLRLDAFNFIKEDINLGLFVEGEVETEDVFADGSHSASVCEHEFFTGLVYSPVDCFECSCGFAMYNVVEDGEKSLDLGMRVGASYNGEYVSLGFNYIPHLYSKTDDIDNGSSHAFELTAGFSI